MHLIDFLVDVSRCFQVVHGSDVLQSEVLLIQEPIKDRTSNQIVCQLQVLHILVNHLEQHCDLV